eukprot:TRINITY_DN93_c0_g2_i1.p1 TRINITY_DN93_c0_g2~~TRINITY_DN93_c0_g2_i1.p1  ORF type:complete len:200 (-),score=60.47 TRINITY_DN93_c0_g2_i1:161-760(-)
MKTIKIVVVGDGAVGKTCMLMSYSSDTFPEDYVPTVFDNYSTPIMIDEQPYTIGLWDTAGQEEYDKMRSLCYPQTDVFLLCFSVVHPTSFENIKLRWVEELKEEAEGIAYLLIGTQIDRRSDKDILEKLDGKSPISGQMGRSLAKEIDAIGYCECSALTQDGLKNVFDTAARYVVKNIFERTENDDDQPVQKKGCCIIM